MWFYIYLLDSKHGDESEVAYWEPEDTRRAIYMSGGTFAGSVQVLGGSIISSYRSRLYLLIRNCDGCAGWLNLTKKRQSCNPTACSDYANSVRAIASHTQTYGKNVTSLSRIYRDRRSSRRLNCACQGGIRSVLFALVHIPAPIFLTSC